MRIFNRLSIASVSILALAVVGTPVFALAANSHANAATTQTTTTTGQPTDAGSQASTNKPTDPGSQGATKLAAAKLKACQKRETAINNILSRISYSFLKLSNHLIPRQKLLHCHQNLACHHQPLIIHEYRLAHNQSPTCEADALSLHEYLDQLESVV